MSDLLGAFATDNLKRAWRWIKSNPEAAYKRYCRPLYSAYAVADETALEDLRKRLRSGTYEPTHATKLYFPKASGVLRPYSLLTVEDQIVYQAFSNIVAERLYPRVRHRYGKEVFGHLYAGRRSSFFYKDWKKGYHAMNKACQEAFKKGYVYGASFDLTACYDSVDHGVLRHFLKDLGLDADFAKHLSQLLCHWTATNHRVYHDHGIPQGPLSSGVIAEAILQHFDNHRGAKKEIRYVRYVDDIRLFAKTDVSLRRMLVQLDMLSKDIGLFPQSSKVDIHRITDIDKELKSISLPPEEVLADPAIDQAELRKRIVELTPKCKIANSTRFRYLLAKARPSARLNDRMWSVLGNHPDAYISILSYFQRYETLPKSVAIKAIREIKRDPVYHAIHAELIRTVHNRLTPVLAASFRRLLAAQWHPSHHTPELTAALGRAGIETGVLNYGQIKHAALKSPDWWVRAELINSLTPEFVGEPSVQAILHAAIRGDGVGDVPMIGAMKIEEFDLAVGTPARGVHRRASNVLREFGRMKKLTADTCGIDQMFVQLLGPSVSGIRWKTFFGPYYKRAERQAVLCRAMVDTNVTAWVPALDVLNDLLLASLFRLRPLLGSHTIGSFKTLYKCPAFSSDFPLTRKMVKNIHDKRLESAFAHAIVSATKKPTGRIRYQYVAQAKRLLRPALLELKKELKL